MVKVLGISSSPRIEGNSDLLLRQALAGAEAVDAQTEYVRLAELNIAPCIECNSCYKTGRCKIQDDYQTLYSKLLETDHLIFATPVFFMTVSAQAKLLIDRCQCLWAHKYVLKKPIVETAGRDRRAMVIAVGGTKSKKMFESIRLTFKYYLDVLDMNYTANLFVNKIDARGQIKENTAAMEQAFRLGREIVTVTTSQQGPVNVEFT